mgnify:FL=1
MASAEIEKILFFIFNSILVYQESILILPIYDDSRFLLKKDSLIGLSFKY